MAEVINMPRLSDTMEEGTVATWFKQVGDPVKEGDILAEIETDKATMEFESFHEGVLLHIGIHQGETAPVDALLAIIGEEGEDVSGLLGGGSSSEVEEKEVPQKSEESSSAVLPDNVEIITMPRLSDTMEEGTVAAWLKKVGDTVAEGDILAEIETDKATMEFESFYTGTLLHIGIAEGESAPVDSVLAIIGDKDADVAQAIAAAENSSTKDTAPKETAPVGNAPSTALKEAVPAPVSAPQQKVVTQTPAVPTATSSNGRIIASPLAKRLAEERNISLNTIQGTGDAGRIIKRDIENYQGASSAASTLPMGIESIQEFPNSQMRKTIAKRLGASKFSAPHYYLGVEFDMSNAMSFRAQYNALPDTKISFNDMVIKATALALKKHPQVNARWHDDKIVQHHHVHMGVAVAVEDGLVVPVVKFADELALPQIGAQVKDFAGRAREKKLTPAEMDGSTFTISNLGMFGIETFTSIINQPNAAILSVGAIVEKPVVKNGTIVVGHTMKLTLACDHRSVDGATGALFLQTLKGYIENPITMLV